MSNLSYDSEAAFSARVKDEMFSAEGTLYDQRMQSLFKKIRDNRNRALEARDGTHAPSKQPSPMVTKAQSLGKDGIQFLATPASMRRFNRRHFEEEKQWDITYPETKKHNMFIPTHNVSDPHQVRVANRHEKELNGTKTFLLKTELLNSERAST